MSWIFGGGGGGKDDKPPIKFSDFYLGNQQNLNQNKNLPEEPNAPEKMGHKMNPYSFDSEALERAAKAAKELESNKNAKEIIAMTSQQYAAKQKELDIQLELVRKESAAKSEENRRQYLREQAELEKQKAQYNDQLARKRNEDTLAMQRKDNEEKLAMQQRMNDERLRKEEESLARQEAMKKASLEHELQQRHKLEIAKVKAGVEAATKKERENKDIHLEEIKLKAQSSQETTLKSLNSIMAQMNSILDNKGKLASFVLGAGGLFGCYFLVKGGTKVGFDFLRARLVTPNLVQETSRMSLFDVLSHPIKTVQKLKPTKKDVMDNIIMSPKVEEQLRDVAIQTKQSVRSRLTKHNVLLYGPPGTGKTLVARQLAKYSGMDYAILSGGNFAGMGMYAIPELEKVFEWCEASRKGVILFIDEAESFLSSRKDMTGEMRNILSVFLSRTGSESNRFSVVFSTNYPAQLDQAILSRVATPIEIPLPTFDERQRMVYQFFNQHILTPSQKNHLRLKVGDFDYKGVCNEVARMTDGMSGRDLSYLILGWRGKALTSEDGVCTKELIFDVTRNYIEAKKTLEVWRQSQKEMGDLWSQAVVQKAKEKFGTTK